jgi:Dyp-type peroxidase family
MRTHPVKVDPRHVQTHVLRSLDPAYAVYVFFRIRDPAAFGDLLKSLVDPNSPPLTVGGAPARIYNEAKWIASDVDQPETGSTSGENGAGPPLVHAHVAFTFSGLGKLGIDPKTLATFPEPFQQGMADRAAILGDSGVAAPEHWDGYLGSKQVHGVLWFDVSRRARKGDPGSVAGLDLEALTSEVLQNLGSRVGIDLLHHETGQANHRQFSSGEVDRVEHFGFRDGVSRPWIEFDMPGAPLRTPPPGGGTPRQDGRWAPLAPGEFLLGYPDEDGLLQPWPCNAKLRHGGTYMVFRKLEQDVVGFRNFLRAGRSARDARKLAAQMIGRWPDGTPLVQSPEGPNEDVPADPNRTLNDFRYKRDDPRGLRCPISAHIRRANPRDTGDRDDVRRHRILRRGIAYGGDLLPEDSPGDGKKRGLLFVALNSRIDQQFEFLHGHWMNQGEFLGQAGAGQDPILGAYRGELDDTFVTPSQPGPATNLTRFVTMRGGDYFFIPGLEALSGLASGESFGLDAGVHPPEDAVGVLETPEPLDPATLLGLSQRLLPPGPNRPNWIPKTAPYQAFPGGPVTNQTVAFVAQHPFVTQILKDDARFGIDAYAQRVSRMTAWGQMLISLQEGGAERVKRHEILDSAMQNLAEYHRPQCPDLGALFASATKTIVQHLLKAVASRGSLDIVGDIGRVAPILLAARVFGVSGPSWVSPTGIAAKFGRADITALPPSWLAGLPEIGDDLKPLLSMQAWTRLAFAQVFVNVVNAAELAALAERAMAEMFQHLGRLIDGARSLPRNRETLLACLVELGDRPEQFGLDQQSYDRHMRLILAEAAVGGVETVNKALTNVINQILDDSEVMEKFHAAAEKDDDPRIDALVRETLRFDPVSPILFRVAKEGAAIGGKPLPAGTRVCLLIKAAMHDPAAFPDPEKCDPDLGPDRATANYLHFGDAGAPPRAPHACWGEGFAVPELREMIKAIVMLPKLRRAAGAKGNIQQELHLPSSLLVRFDPSQDAARPAAASQAGSMAGPEARSASSSETRASQ